MVGPVDVSGPDDEPGFLDAAFQPLDLPEQPTQDPQEQALVDEALKKSGLIWVRVKGRPTAQAMWHVWLDAQIHVVTGGQEQPDPGLAPGTDVWIVVRSKDNVSRLIQIRASVAPLEPADPRWNEITTALAKSRLNLRESATAGTRWATDPAYALFSLTPQPGLVEGPGNYPDTGHRLAPEPTTATTVTRRPLALHRRGTSGPPLS